MSNYNIYYRKDGRFEGRIYSINSKGKRKYKSIYGLTRAEVEFKMKKALKTKNHFSSIEKTITEVADEWVKSVSVRIKDSTLSNYKIKLDKHIIPVFGKMQCCSLNRNDIYMFIEHERRSGLSVRYISDILVVLKSVLKYAVQEYNIKNVFDGLILPKKPRVSVRILSDTEQLTLKKYIISNTDRTTLGIAISLYTGLRIGELCALKCSDIDFENRLIVINKTVQRIQSNDKKTKTKLIISDPKSESSNRVVPLPECLLPLFKTISIKNDTFLLSGADTPLEPRTMQYRFASILENANLPSVHFHSLRHAFATKCVSLGFDVKTLSEILGHSSVEMTLNRYVHSSLDRKKAYMNLLSL